MKKHAIFFIIIFYHISLAQSYIRFDVQNLEAGPALGPWMCESTIPANPFVNDGDKTNGDYAYKFVGWNTEIGDPNPDPCTGIDELSSSTCIEENTAVLETTDNVTLELDGFTLAQFHHINTVDPNANWDVMGQAGDERIYAGGSGEIKVNGVTKLKATNCRITLRVCYSDPMGEGDIVSGSGWGVIDAANSDAAWVAEFDPEGVGQLEFDFETFSPVIQSCYGKYDATIKVKPAPNKELISVQHAYDGNGLKAAVDLSESDVSFNLSSATKGGADNDEDYISANQVKKAPGGTKPANVASISECYWQLGTTLSDFNTDVTFDLSDLTGLNPKGIKILKRETTEADWQIYADVTKVDADHYKANNVDNFSEFGIASEALAGEYTIGSGGDFANLNDAVTSLIANGISSAVTFNIISGTYTEQITLPSITGSSAVNTITFQSQTGNAGDVTIQYDASGSDDNWIIKCDGADYVNIKNLTLTCLDASYGHILHITSNSAHITINQCTLNGIDAYSDNGTIIYAGATEYLSVTNDTFNNGYRAALLIGNSGSYCQGNSFSNNQFNNQNEYSIYLQYQQNLIIEKNTFNTVSGFYAGFCTSNTIRKNIMSCSDIGFWMKSCSGTSENPNIISNNMISINSNTSTSAVLFSSGQYHNIYYNTVTFSGNSDNTCTTLRYSGSQANISNNILINERDGYAYQVDDPSDINTSDYNNFYTSGTNIASWSSTNYGTVAGLFSVSGKDENSVSNSVNFISSSNLHLTGSSVGDSRLSGTPVASVTDDIDDEARDANHPYMGADENTVSPLPVEIISFEASFSRKVELKWETATEINNYGFEVQRSKAGSQKSEVINYRWEKIGFVEGNGNSNSVKKYSFVDEAIPAGKYYYRLKQIDNDGTAKYSDEVEVEVAKPTSFSLEQNYPNPFNPSTKINYSLPEDSHVVLKLYDIIGREVKTLVNENKHAGMYSVDLIGEGLSDGVYIYKITAGKFSQARKMILMK